MQPHIDLNNVQDELKNIPTAELSNIFKKVEGLTDIEIEQNDKKDAYALRKCFNDAIQKTLNFVPFLVKCVIFTMTLSIVIILMFGTFYLVQDKDKLFDTLWNVVWTGIVYMASYFVNNKIFKKAK